MKDKFYITTAIAYTSRKPHIGNTYEVVLTDAIARYKRKRDYDVFFLTGTDEHGQKIQQEAEKSGITPQQYVDGVAGEIREIWDLMNSSYDKLFRKFLRNSMIRAIFIKVNMKVTTAYPANPSLQRLSL